MNESKKIQKEKHNLLIRFLSHRVPFALHLFLYVAVMGLLILIWAITSGFRFFWPFFPLFGWGFGVGFHAATFFMYNDKFEIEYLSKIRKQSTFGVLFIYHAWFYISVNVFLIIINLVLTPDSIFSIYPLLFWGIAFGTHAFGFFLWGKLFDQEMTMFKSKYPEYGEKKLKMMINSKISNFWILIIHIAYFIIVNIWLYASGILSTSGVEGTLGWATFLGVHIFGYALYYYVEAIKSVIKGLLINIAFYAALNAWMIYQFVKQPSVIFWPIYPLILVGVIIAIHVYVCMNWDSIKEEALALIERQFGDKLEKYELESKAFKLNFWKWTFITHIAVWGGGIILIGIQMALVGIPVGLVIHPAMGWLIIVAIHGSIFLIYQKNIQGFWKPTAIIHLAAFLSTNAYLIVLNVLTTPFPWSAIAIAGWGIGLGLHLLIAYLRK